MTVQTHNGNRRQTLEQKPRRSSHGITQEEARPPLSSNREVIDARGSIDSRTFNETGVISSVAKDSRDRHEPAVDARFAQSRWRSRKGNTGFSEDVRSGRIGYGRVEKKPSGMPALLKIAIPIIAVLAVIVVLVFFLPAN